ncbi:MAG TPA: hypothetical protein VIF62_21890 [Labilithrix sp.]
MRASLLLAFLLPAACSGGGSSDGASSDLHEDAGADAGVDASPPPAQLDAGAPDGGLAFPACLGDTRPLVFDRGLPFTPVSVGAAPSPYAGAFLVDFATTRSAIDLGAFAAPGPTASNCDPSMLGQSCGFADLDFFGAWGPVTLVTENFAGGTPRQAGIVGTDFLAVHVFTLDWKHSQIRRATKATRCADASLSAFASLDASGFFANDAATLKPLSDVDAQAAAGLHVPNVPTVPIAVAGATAVVQLDTGFLDSVVPHSVNVNVAFFDAIDPNALVRDAARDTSLTTCAGVAESVEAYRLAPGSAVALGPRSWSDATIFVKRTPDAAKSCGGIGTWTAPAAQIGVSFFVDLGVVVFDPFASRVWIPKSG